MFSKGKFAINGETFPLEFDVSLLQDQSSGQLIWEGNAVVEFLFDDETAWKEVLRFAQATLVRPVAFLELITGERSQVRCAHVSTKEEVDACYFARWNFY